MAVRMVEFAEWCSAHDRPKAELNRRAGYPDRKICEAEYRRRMQVGAEGCVWAKAAVVIVLEGSNE